MYKLVVLISALIFASINAFASVPAKQLKYFGFSNQNLILKLSESNTETSSVTPATPAEGDEDPMAEAMMDAEQLLQLEKQRRADELRAQEVFMKRSTGKHKCTNCDWEYDETKGDAMMIGGMIKPDTTFAELPSNWRCPVCRASKDSFTEVVEEIPGFEVNQGYGLGGNSMTSDQKNLIIFGGLGLFFILFLAGYGLS